MNKKFNFTIAAINKIISPKMGRDEYRDTKIPELTLRVTANGVKSFSVAKKIKGKYVRAKLGRFPANTIEQARKKAREKLSLMEDGINPSELKREERLKNVSVLDLYHNYEENFNVSREHTWTKPRKEKESSLGLGENEV